MKNKLDNFPPVHFISVDYCEDRRQKLKEKFSKFGITNITGHIFKKYEDGDRIIESDYNNIITNGSKGAVTSHLLTIKEWYNTTNESYAFICEDDLSLELVDYWNFTWNDFYNHLPEDWKIIQLCWLREDEFDRFRIGFRNRCWCDWSGCAYLIKREYAKKIIDTYCPDDIFFLNLKGKDVQFREEWAKVPVIETIIFSQLEDSPIYGAPLFTEDLSLQSSYQDPKSDEAKNHKVHNGHWESYQNNLNWWKNKGSNMSIDQFMDPNFFL